MGYCFQANSKICIMTTSVTIQQTLLFIFHRAFTPVILFKHVDGGRFSENI